MPTSIFEQADWSAGIFRGRRAPENAFYDGVNALVDDEGQLYKRGGSTFRSASNAGEALTGVADVSLGGGRRTVAWSASYLVVLDAVNAPVQVINLASLSITIQAFARAAVMNGFMILPLVNNTQLFLYAGSLKAANYATGTVTVTANSSTVTGVGTSWTTSVDPGMIIDTGANTYGIVESVTNNTTLTLVTPWTGGTAAGAPYTLRRYLLLSFPVTNTTHPRYYAVAGNRLLATTRSQVFFGGIGTPMSTSVTDFHQIPGGAHITGEDAIGDTGLIFTTSGVWAISNLAFDAVDDYGNVQHQVAQINKDVVLWGDPGIAAWQGTLVVPAVDDVYLMGLDGSSKEISEGVRPLYREYIRSGYQPGTAAAHRGHYLLPVLNGSTLVDVLVCRLDRGFAWTRLAGHAACAAYAQRIGSDTRSPQLFAISGQRIVDVTGMFSPSGAVKGDADGGTPNFDLVTRDYDLGPRVRRHLLRRVRLEYELVDAGSDNPTLTGSVALGREGASFTALSGAAGESDGLVAQEWMVDQDGERARLRVQSSGPSADLRIKRLELHTRQVERI